jgi:NAD(P)-dependent dehydrogenase (short-subunit alcohol dehydrogenase family)
MSINIDLSNKKAMITGVSSGIGMGIAASLAQAGCDIAGCGLEAADSPGALQFISKVEGHGRRAFYQSANIAEEKSCRGFVGWAVSQLGKVDIVVSNAGRNIFKGVEKTSEEDWQANLELNLAAHWRVTQTAKPYLENAEQPVIIIITSNHAYRTLSDSFPYNVAKAGLTAMVQSIAIEWGPHIRTVGIAPGFIETPLGETWFNNFPNPAAKRAEVVAMHPVGRMGTPIDIGVFCAFLVSPLASFISGTTLLIDGGRSAIMQDD